MALANTKRVPIAHQTLLASLPQTPGVAPNHGNTYTNLRAAGMIWHDYVSLREQGFIVEQLSNGAEPDIAITTTGVCALTFNR